MALSTRTGYFSARISRKAQRDWRVRVERGSRRAHTSGYPSSTLSGGVELVVMTTGCN